MKILENLWQSSETFGNLRKQFKSVFHRCYDFLKFSENLRKSSEVFGNLRNFLIFFNFRKSSEIFRSIRKSSEIFGKLRKRFKSNFQMFL